MRRRLVSRLRSSVFWEAGRDSGQGGVGGGGNGGETLEVNALF